MTLVLNVVSPKTPSDIFAAMVLSPTVSTGAPNILPVLHFSPPTSTSSSSSPSSLDSPPSPTQPSQPLHRSLATNEAKQLSLLLSQHLFPVRHSQKSLMKESIALAEKLDEAGIRWDKKRRVMGMHLRGIWEEGQRLGHVKSIGGHSPMDLYVQGSFLSVAEEPHPLDPMPIPIEVHPASFAALPKLTLQAGLVNSLPGIMPAQYEVDGPRAAHIPTMRHWSEAMEVDEPGHTPGPMMRLARTHVQAQRRGLRDRKKAGLKIRVDRPMMGRAIRAAIESPRSAALLSGRRSTFAGLLPKHTLKWMARMRKGKDTAMLVLPATAGVRSARRVSFGGYEVR